MKPISKYISYNEATTSQTAIRKGIDNTPTAEALKNMELVATEVFDKVREYFGKPLRVSSFYRSPKLNTAVGGSKTSQHVTGQAIDIQGLGQVTNQMIFNYIKDNLEFTQLINEYNFSWVHVSYDPKNLKKQILKIG